MMRQPEITWVLPMDQANTILNILGKQPYETIADLIMNLRMQAQPQVEQFQRMPSPDMTVRGPSNGDARPT